MGSSASKAAQTTAQRTARKFPPATRPPRAGTRPQAPTTPAASRVNDNAATTAARSESADAGTASDLISAAFSKRLERMGVAQPNPTFSPSSTFAPSAAPSAGGSNAALSVLEARRVLEDRAADESQQPGRPREFLNAATIRDILVLREGGALDPAGIEARLHLKPGVVEKLGPPGLVSAMMSSAREVPPSSSSS